MAVLTEDDIYRTSTQYRLWSFTRESLVSLRTTTNATAAEGVRAAIRNLHSQKTTDATQQDGNQTGYGTPQREVDCLSMEEEQRMVEYYCRTIMKRADFFPFPTNVKATAVQYLKRFYLSNSPMTYHPKEIVPTAVFLATKTENNCVPLEDFASKLPKTTPDDVLAPEFLLTQGLRFTFDVRHPQRGLEGGYMELIALAKGDGQPRSGNSIPPDQLQKDMMDLEPAKSGAKVSKSAEEVLQRIERVKGKVKETLKTSALLTDAYFLYTPSQIWLSALLLADGPLARFYIDTKFPTPSTLKPKLMTTLQACAALLHSSPPAEPEEVEFNALKKIDKKLYLCRNPEKIDLVGINKAQKRDGGTEDQLDEKIIKKRKLEREKSEREAEDTFGPALSKK